MIKLICRGALFAIVMACAIKTNAQTLVWSDEFRLPKLDHEKWSSEVGGNGFGNGELEYYTSGESNVFIGTKADPADTGYLVIEARKENYGVAPENRQFTSGRINTSGKFNFKYGAIEARIKLPNLQNGLWPAFWMLGANYPTEGWPKSGEIDILEAGFKDDWKNNVANKKNNTTVHWFQDNFKQLDPNAPGDGWYGNANATNSTTIAGSFNDGYHIFKLTWTPTKIEGYVDGTKYYDFIIPNDVNFTEFSNPFFIILNLAVGGSNFVGIGDPAQITAPFPAQMLVDYVRVYSNADTETFQAANLPRETGTFGVFTETTPVTNSLGATPTVDIWNNLTTTTSVAQEGTNVLAFTANPGNWFGLGIPTGAGNEKNMQNFIDGNLHFQMKTTSTWPMSIGILSAANGNAQGSTQSKSVKLDPAGNQYGLLRDGQWHEVIIPFTAFGNIEFRSINDMFYLVGDNPSAPVTFAIDNIYWTDGTKITPENGDYVIFSDTHVGVDQFDLGTDGEYYVWESTLTPQTTAPAEGTNVLSYTNNGKGWFGAAFTASAMHNLTAFQNADAKLVFSMKTSDTSTPFYIGMKSGTRDGEGQKWIAFEAGKTPYGFKRDGVWHTVEIPMSDLYDAINLMEVTQLFEILGTANIGNIAFDNIYFTGGTTALPDLGPNAPPEVNAGADQILRSGNSIMLTGSATDSDGTVESYAWTVQSGPNTPTLSDDDTEVLTASGLVAGIYVFRLTATDDESITGFDEVSVFVGPNLIPTANAGIDKTLSLPTTSIVLNGSGADVDGTIALYTWTIVSGPNTPTLTDASTESVTAGDLIQGTYQFKLTVTDNEGATGFDLVNLEVTANTPPTADAGDDQIITLPTNSIVITGSGTDTGIVSSYAWSVLSGSNTPTLAGDDADAVTVSNLVAGVYVLELTVTDNGGLTDTDQVTITVKKAPINLALLKPTTTSSIENGTTVGASAVDGNMATRWSSAFSDPQWIYVNLGDKYSITEVKITWEAAYGKDYLVQLSDDATTWTTIKTVTGNSSLVNDHTGLSGSGKYIRIYGTTRGTPYGYSIFELEVYGDPAAVSGSPTANAGDDQNIGWPDTSAILNGSGTDEDGTIASYAWVFVSGPNTPDLSGADTQTPTASNLVPGTYVFKLTVTDNDGKTGTDQVSVTFANPVDAGDDVTITLPTNEVTLHGKATNEVAVTYAWTQVSGPSTAVLTDASTSTLKASNLITGTYVFKLTVTADGDLSATDEVSVTVQQLTVTGVEVDKDNVVEVYPIPALQILFVKGLKDGSNVTITSSTGIDIGNKTVINRSIDISELPAGFYILDCKGLKSARIKFIKE
jgi:beta-glucanase (GH16 family)